MLPWCRRTHACDHAATDATQNSLQIEIDNEPLRFFQIEPMVGAYPTADRHIEYEFNDWNRDEIEDARDDLDDTKADEYRTKWYIKANIVGIIVAFIACAYFSGCFFLILV